MSVESRLRENELQVNAIREGLFSVIPPSLVGLFSWHDLEQFVCGRPTIDLTILKRHTTYSPPFTEADEIIGRFWRVLEGFTEEERLSFVRFAWARSRLPAEDGSYRMRINIVKVSSRCVHASFCVLFTRARSIDRCAYVPSPASSTCVATPAQPGRANAPPDERDVFLRREPAAVRK